MNKIGTYVGIRPAAATKEYLNSWFISNSHIKPEQDLHLTLLYSRNKIPVKLNRDFHVATPKGFDIFGECLVLLLNIPSAVARHNYFVSRGGTHDFLCYNPHMTLSSVGDDFDLKSLTPFNFNLVFDSEYWEDLDLSK